jgi:hypothetical protein
MLVTVMRLNSMSTVKRVERKERTQHAHKFVVPET